MSSPRALRQRRPLTGARIETRYRPAKHVRVASPPHGGADRNDAGAVLCFVPAGRPLTGARIETDPRLIRAVDQGVAPSRGRGSKLHFGGRRDRHQLRRRPLTGARIETSPASRSPTGRSVAPSRGRGSKRLFDDDRRLHRSSPPHGGADRNIWRLWRRLRRSRRPLTGARIETTYTPYGTGPNGSRPLTGARIETFAAGRDYNPLHVAPSRGRGSKLVSPACQPPCC